MPKYQTNSGLFNKKVIFLKPVEDFDSSGSPVIKWHPAFSEWVVIEPLSGREYWQASQSQGEATVKIQVKYRKDITDKMQILFKSGSGDVYYEMKSPPINYQEKNETMQLMCRVRS